MEEQSIINEVINAEIEQPIEVPVEVPVEVAPTEEAPEITEVTIDTPPAESAV